MRIEQDRITSSYYRLRVAPVARPLAVHGDTRRFSCPRVLVCNEAATESKLVLGRKASNTSAQSDGAESMNGAGLEPARGLQLENNCSGGASCGRRWPARYLQETRNTSGPSAFLATPTPYRAGSEQSGPVPGGLVDVTV